MRASWNRRFGFSLVSVVLLTGCSGTSGSMGRSADVLVMDAAVNDGAALVMDAMPTPDASPMGKLLFVSPDDSSDGDGRRRTPFGSIEAAYGVAVPGDIVVLLPGEYGGLMGPPEGVLVQGSGADVTSIQGPVVLRAARVGLSEVSVVGGRPALTVDGTATVDTVTLRDAPAALVVTGELEARELRISEVRDASAEPRSFDGPTPSSGAAVLVADGGRLVWRGGGISSCDWVGLRNLGEASLDGVNIRDLGGPGLVNEAGQLDGRRLQVERVSAAAVLVLGGDIELEDSSVRDTEETPLVPLRSGIAAYGGTALLSAIDIARVNRGLRLSRGAQVIVSGVQITQPTIDGVSMDDARIDGARLTVVGARNTGLSAVSESEVNLTQLEVQDVGRIGLLVNGSTAHVEGLTVAGSDGRGVTLSGAQGTLSGIDLSRIQNVGIQVSDPGGPQTIQNGVIERSSTSGIALTGMQHEVVISGVTVSAIAIGDAGLGEGIHLFRARGALIGVTSHGNAGAGVLVEESTLRSDGLAVRENAGPGIVLVGSGPETALAGLTAIGNAGAGALVLQGAASFTDLEITGTLLNLAVGTGDGLVASVSATVAVERGRSDGNAGSGYSIQAGCTATLDTVTASENGGWGLKQVCGQSVVEVRGDSSFEENAAGTMTPCP